MDGTNEAGAGPLDAGAACLPDRTPGLVIPVAVALMLCIVLLLTAFQFLDDSARGLLLRADAGWEGPPPGIWRYLSNPLCQVIIGLFLTLLLYLFIQASAVALERALWLGRTVRPRWLATLREGIADLRLPARLPIEIGADAAAAVLDQRAHAAWIRLEPLRYGVWAMPVLGFIGTVTGISGAVQGLEALLGAGGPAASAGMDPELAPIGGVTGQLYFAFDTTLVGLICMLILALGLSWLSERELALDRLVQQQLRLRAVPAADAALGRPDPPATTESMPEPLDGVAPNDPSQST